MAARVRKATAAMRIDHLPLISCIMPTRNRRRFIPQALKYFLWQDYPNKELVIVDDGEDTIADLLPSDARIRYVFISEPCTIGMKRNLAVSLASGDFICHWDDDDYYGSQRLTRQVEPILQERADVTAFRMSLLLNAQDGTLWECSEDIHALLFTLNIRAGTLLYCSSAWHEGLCYGNFSNGEDVRFLHGLLASGLRLERIVDPHNYICVRHTSNVTDDLDVSGWQAVSLEAYLPEEERAFYLGLRVPCVGGVRA